MYVTGFDTPFSAASSSIPAGGLALQQKEGADRLDAAASSTAHTTVSLRKFAKAIISNWTMNTRPVNLSGFPVGVHRTSIQMEARVGLS